jgi:hypothetical protein
MKSILFVLMMAGAGSYSEEIPTLRETYRSGNWSFTGTVDTDMGDFHSVHTFSGSMNPDEFELKWVNKGGFNSGGSVKIDKNGGVVKMEGLQDSAYPDAEMAMAAATGVSGGSARIMYFLWVGRGKELMPSGDVKVVSKDGIIEVSGNGCTPAERVVLNIKDGVLLSLRSIYDPALDTEGHNVPEMTDEVIKESLKMMGKSQTQDEVDKMKVMLKDAQEVIGKNKSKIDSMTKITISEYNKVM